MLGEFTHEDTLNAMAACKIYVSTSKREGFPTALLEAMSFEKPTIAPNVIGCNEIITHKKNGFLYQPSDIEDLKSTIYKAIESKNIGLKGKKHVTCNYTWKKLIKKIDTIYESNN